jgi:hypothetical protein
VPDISYKILSLIKNENALAFVGASHRPISLGLLISDTSTAATVWPSAKINILLRDYALDTYLKRGKIRGCGDLLKSIYQQLVSGGGSWL